MSIAAHVCALWLLATVLGDRRISLSSDLASNPTFPVTTISRREPVAATKRVPVAIVADVVEHRPNAERTAKPGAHPAAYHPRKVIAATAPARRPVRGREPRGRSPAAAAPRIISLAIVTPEPTATPRPAATVAAATPLPTPAATPTDAPTVGANFGGLFSQNYPPAIAAPADLATIRSHIGGPLHIRVDVDETGHATDVRFIRPPGDEALAMQIRSELLAMHYVPADCNGLHCDGTLEINY